jgi:methyl-accepting chemotaxis protein
MNLQIRHKLVLLVVAAMLLLIAAGVFSFIQAGRLYLRLEETVQTQGQVVRAVDAARAAQVAFKTQVQEWKNILLRGKDPAAFDKYLKGFDSEEAAVRKELGEVRSTLGKLGLDSRLDLAAIEASFAKLGPAYREALKQYDRNSPDPAATVDKLVRGIDREPTKAIDTLVADVEKLSDELNTRDRDDARAIYGAVKSGLLLFAAGAIAVLVALAGGLIRSITGPLDRLAATMAQIATSGDLTHRAEVGRADEIGRMAQAFNAMMAQLQTLIGEVRRSSDRVASAAQQLSSSSTALAEVSEHQSSVVSGSAAAIEELTVAIAAVSETSGEVQSQARDSVARTAEGSGKVSQLAGEIGHLQDNMAHIAGTVQEFLASTRAITDMTQEVRDLADQTNLLALNAAIEAARAGEAGRGFAVVADEVHKLAEKSGKSASAIDRVTQAIVAQSAAVQEAIASGEQAIAASTALASEVEGALDFSRRSVEQSTLGVGEITSSVGEQRIASTEIAQNMERIANMVEETSFTARNIHQASVDLQQLASGLMQSVAGFRVA